MNIVSKTKNAIAPELTRILYSEIAALGQIGELQKNIEKAVYEKQWTDFDAAAHCLAEHRTALEALEAEKTETERLLSLPEVFTSGEKSKAAQEKLQLIIKQLEEAETRWAAMG